MTGIELDDILPLRRLAEGGYQDEDVVRVDKSLA